MLKIKDNVDLKELEKFGFMHRKLWDNYMKLHSEKNFEDYVDNYLEIDNRILKPFARTLNGYETKYCDNKQVNIKDEFLDTLYDLIKADLVEKVSD